jgi:hypothetical protein
LEQSNARFSRYAGSYKVKVASSICSADAFVEISLDAQNHRQISGSLLDIFSNVRLPSRNSATRTTLMLRLKAVTKMRGVKYQLC